MALSNLDSVVVVSTDGSYFGLSSAYLINIQSLTPEQIEDLYEGTDGDRADLCGEVGTNLKELVSKVTQ